MIAGYCWPRSVLSPGSVTLFCSTRSERYRVEVSRSGLKEKKVFASAVLRGPFQAKSKEPALDGCGWKASLEINIEAGWPSGCYLVRLIDEDGSRAEAFFVVRALQPKDAMFVLSTSTWDAYNDWGAPSFYTGGVSSSALRPLPRGMLFQAEPGRHRISFHSQRTQDDVDDIDKQRYENWFLNAGWANWECLFAFWAEGQGLDLGYSISSDLDGDADLLAGYPAYVSVGHDEYWSAGMRDNVESFVDAGGSAAFFSGNTAFWQARFESDHSRLVSYKFKFADDPRLGSGDSKLITSMWSDPILGRPENLMTGVSFTRGGYSRVPNSPQGTGGYTIHRPGHWVFDSLNLSRGDVLGRAGTVVGYECDGCDYNMRDGVPVPSGVDGTHESFEILGVAPAHLWETSEVPGVISDDYAIGELNWVAERLAGEDTSENRSRFTDGTAILGTFRRGKGEVFTTGCTDWAYGLQTEDVSRVTQNVMRRFTKKR